MKKSILLLCSLIASVSVFSQGHFVWAKQAGNAYNDKNVRVVKGTDGLFRLVGKTISGAKFDTLTTPNNFAQDVPFVACLDSKGNFKWANVAKVTNGASVAMDAATDAQGNTYVTGYFAGSLRFDNINAPYGNGCNSVMFVAKFDTVGKCIWLRSAASLLFNCYPSAGLSIKMDDDGNLLMLSTGDLTGSLLLDTLHVADVTNRGGAAILVAKLNTDGKFLWGTLHKISRFVNATTQGDIKLFKDQGNWCFTGRCLQGDTMDNVIIPTTGGYIFRLDGSGHITANYNFSSSVTLNDSYADGNGWLYVTGYYGSSGVNVGGVTMPPAAYNNGFVGKISTTSGLAEWAKGFGSNVNQGGSGNCIAVQGSRIFMSGGANDGTVFDANTFNSGSATFLFVAEMDTAGHFLYELPVYNSSGNGLYCVAFDSDSSCLLGGFANGTMDCGPDTLKNTGMIARFVSGASVPTAITQVELHNTGFELYPNPANNRLIIKSVNADIISAINIYDLSGRAVISTSQSAYQAELNVAYLAPGLYIAEILCGTTPQKIKWVKE